MTETALLGAVFALLVLLLIFWAAMKVILIIATVILGVYLLVKFMRWAMSIQP